MAARWWCGTRSFGCAAGTPGLDRDIELDARCRSLRITVTVRARIEHLAQNLDLAG